MDSVQFLPSDAAYLVAKTQSAALAARELLSFWSEEPELAGQASVEVLALEAKSLLSGGMVERISTTANSAKPMMRRDDLDSAFRLDTIVALSSARLAGLESALETDQSDGPMNKLSGIVTLAATVLGIVKTLF
jgi:hypothetical protein